MTTVEQVVAEVAEETKGDEQELIDQDGQSEEPGTLPEGPGPGPVPQATKFVMQQLVQIIPKDGNATWCGTGKVALLPAANQQHPGEYAVKMETGPSAGETSHFAEFELYAISEPEPEAAADPKVVKTAEDDAAQLHRGMDKIYRARQHAAVCLAEWERAKGEANAAKKDYDDAVEALMKEIDAQNTVLPLFDQKRTAPAAETSEETKPTETSPAGDALGLNGWEKTSVDILESEFHVRHRYIKALKNNEPPIETLEDLAKAKQASGDRLFMWPKGIGKEGATEIDDAVEKVMEKRAKQMKEEATKAEEPATETPTDEKPPLLCKTCELAIVEGDETVDDDEGAKHHKDCYVGGKKEEGAEE